MLSISFCASAFHGSEPLRLQPRLARQSATQAPMVDSWYRAGTRSHQIRMSSDAEDAPEGPKKREAYFCNDEGCWIAEQYLCDETGCWIDAAPPPVVLPDGRIFQMDSGVESHEGVKQRTPVPRKTVTSGIFAPAVKASKTVLGEKELNKLRGKVIAEHSKVISAFVDTSESGFGQLVLKQMFEAADKDGDGTLSKEEVREALHALGFKFIKEKQIDMVFERGDLDGNEVQC